MLQFALRVERVEVDHDRTHAQRREVQYREIGAVRQAQAEPIALAQPLILQSTCCTANELPHLRISPGSPEKVDGDAFGIKVQRIVEEVGQEPWRNCRFRYRREGADGGLGHGDLQHQKWKRPPSDSTTACASSSLPSIRIGVCTAVPA